MTRVGCHWLWFVAGTVIACGSGDLSSGEDGVAGEPGGVPTHGEASGAGGAQSGGQQNVSGPAGGPAGQLAAGGAGAGGGPGRDDATGAGGASATAGTSETRPGGGQARGGDRRGAGEGGGRTTGFGGSAMAGSAGRAAGGAAGRGTGGATGSGAGGLLGVAGSAGRVAGGASGRGAGGAAGRETDGGAPGDCDSPPPSSELVGWAAVSGNGVTTTTGGGDATPVIATSLADLQAAVKGTNAAVVHVKGVLSPGTLTIGSNKTIVGLCGAEIHGHVGLDKSSNVIVRNIKIVGYAVGDCSLDPEYSSSEGCSSGSDAISIQGQSHHLWFDHDDISDGTDGNLDLTHATDYVTISWTKFHYTKRADNVGSDSTGASGHRFSNLVGHDDDNASEDTGHLRITWHHDWWADNVVERQPRIRFGQNHIFNNLWTSSGDNYCIGVGVGANIRTENNVFGGVKTPINTTSYSDSTSAVASTGNLYKSTTGTAPADMRAGSVFDPSKSYSYRLDSAEAVEQAVRTGAGPQNPSK